MKTLKIFLAIMIGCFALVSCGKTEPVKQRSTTVNPAYVAVFYSADDANQVAGAAICAVKYEHCLLFDIDNMTTAQQLAAIQTITDSVNKAYLLCDTATAWATNKLTGAQYDSIDERLFNDTAYTVAPAAAPNYIQATSTKSKAQVLWDLLYPNITYPLAVEYIGISAFYQKSNRTKHVNTDSTAVDTTGSLTGDAYNNMWIYIYSGTGAGQYRQIYDNSTTTYYVSPDWTVRPDKTSLYRIKKNGEQNEVFYDQYTDLYIKTYLSELSQAEVLPNWHKLLDANYNINDGNVKATPIQDVSYLKNTVLATGKYIYDYLVIVEDDF